MYNKEIKEMSESLMELSPDARDAIVWVIRHINIIDSLMQEDELSPEELKDLLDTSYRKKDYTSVAILLYKEWWDKEKDGNLEI